MYNVSEEYKSQIRNTLRNPSSMRVKFNIVDPDAKDDSSFSDDGHTEYSDVDNFEVLDPEGIYTTLEHNLFILDGNSNLPPESAPYEYQGYASDVISNEDNIFTAQPRITIDFLTEKFIFIGFTFDFDLFNGSYPGEIRIRALNDLIEVYNELHEVDKAINFVIIDDIPLCNKIEIICTKTIFPYSRFKLQEFSLGVLKIFSDSELESTIWKRDVDPISAKLPEISFDFTIIDENSEYDPENPSGVYPYMEEKQDIFFEYGYELEYVEEEFVELPNGVIDTISYETNLITRNVGKVILNGTESWLERVDIPRTNTIVFQYRIYDNAIANVISDLFDTEYSENDYEHLSPTVWSGDLLVKIFIEKSKLITLDTAGFKAWLVDNNLTIHYQLETPYTEPIPYPYPSAIEWIPGGKVFTSGNVEASSRGKIPKATFKTVSTLGVLNDIYKEGIYSAVGETLYNLAETILEYADIPLSELEENRWILDTSLQLITTNMPLPKDEIRNLLQLIANAGMCVLDVDRNGFITIKPIDYTLDDFSYTFTDMYEVPIVSRFPLLQGVDSDVNTINIDTALTKLGDFQIAGASNTVYELDHKTANGIIASAGAGLTINGAPEYFAEMCRINLTGTGLLTLDGYVIEVLKNVISSEFNTYGERCPISNILIMDATHATNYAQWIGEGINRRNQYKISDRGFPELDTGDVVSLDTIYVEGVEAAILSSEISYNGTISGKTKLLINGGN